MKVADYTSFVRKTDRFSNLNCCERRKIALYGVVGELGSLTSAIKKKLLGGDDWRQPNDEIIEEMGDLIWYGTSLAAIENQDKKPINILANDIKLLRAEVGAKDDRAREIRAILDEQKREEFLAAAGAFPATKGMTFDHYQVLAYKTARTEEQVLLTVCVAVLGQLGAELLRQTMPDVEKRLNTNLRDRPVNTILGEIAWHIAAIASILGITLNDVVAKNVEKVSYLLDDGDARHTPHHDRHCLAREQLPRSFKVAFVSIKPIVRRDRLLARSRMFLNGGTFGDDLTDNADEDDGYRFHDVFHLANVAHLGWSPVVRKLLDRKRKSLDDETDEVQDGARAQIVEELLVKAIHTEGEKLAKDEDRCSIDGPVRLFPESTLVSYRLIKMLRSYLKGLEVKDNNDSEWRRAIVDGAAMYNLLREHEQGTVTVDMDSRTLTFSPDVYLSTMGVPVGLGIARSAASNEEASTFLTNLERAHCDETRIDARTLLVAKFAVLDSLGLAREPTDELSIKLRGREVSVRPRGAVREQMWHLSAVTFQLAFDFINGVESCTALALADLKPMKV